MVCSTFDAFQNSRWKYGVRKGTVTSDSLLLELRHRSNEELGALYITQRGDWLLALLKRSDLREEKWLLALVFLSEREFLLVIQ